MDLNSKQILGSPLQNKLYEDFSVETSKVETNGVIKDEINIQYDYFTNKNESHTIALNSVLKNKIMYLEVENSELVKKNSNLKKENEELTSKISELFKMMNELLKIEPKNSNDYNFASNYEEIKNKITLMFYREIRMKHILPFSKLVSPYGLSTILSKNNIKKSISQDCVLQNQPL